MTLFTQVAIAIISIIFLILAARFRDLKTLEKEKDNPDDQKINKYLWLCRIFLIITIIGIIYFIFHLITTTPFTFWNTVGACVKAIIFTIIIIEIIFYDPGSKKDWNFEIDFDAGAAVIVSIIIILGSWINYEVESYKYEKNITVIEEIRYSNQEYKLLKEFNVSDFEENDIVNNAISEYFNYNAVRYSSSYVSRTYDIYYLVDKDGNSEKIYKTLNGKDTKLLPIEKGEEPYLEIKTHTQYGIDNNQEPAAEIIVEEKIEYVLHVPKEDVNEVLELAKQE